MFGALLGGAFFCSLCNSRSVKTGLDYRSNSPHGGGSAPSRGTVKNDVGVPYNRCRNGLKDIRQLDFICARLFFARVRI